jgi:hypothetical protein
MAHNAAAYLAVRVHDGLRQRSDGSGLLAVAASSVHKESDNGKEECNKRQANPQRDPKRSQIVTVVRAAKQLLVP